MDQVSITGIRVSYLTLHRHSWREGVWREKDREEGMERARETETERRKEGERRERDE